MTRTQDEELFLRSRRLFIAEQYARGNRSQQGLAASWNAEHPDRPISRGSAHRDIQVIKKWWQAQAIEYIGHAVVEELAKINAVEQEAWAAWRRSQKIAERKRMSKKTTPVVDGDGPPEIVEQSLSIETEEQAGDDRFLARVCWCIERRAKMLGLDAPSVTELHLPGMVEQETPTPAATVHDLRREVLNDPAYLDYLRRIATDCDAGAVRQDAGQHQQSLAVLPPPTDAGP